MAEQMVTVTLDRSRMYRPLEDDTQVFTVGPGEVQVPEWVAREWGMLEGAQQQPEQETSTGPSAIDTEITTGTTGSAQPGEWQQPLVDDQIAQDQQQEAQQGTVEAAQAAGTGEYQEGNESTEQEDPFAAQAEAVRRSRKK